MKKATIIIGMVLVLMSTCLPVAMAVDDIEIAFIYPLSGALAQTGQLLKYSVETAAEIINGSYNLPIPFGKGGGIPNLGGAKLRVKFYDHQASPEIGKAEVERILQEGKAKLIIGSYNSGVTKAASFATERQKFPFLCCTSSSPELTERGLKYFFRLCPTDAAEAMLYFDFFDDMKAKGYKIHRIASANEKTEFGTYAANEAIKRAKEKGYEVVADVPYPFKSTDVNAEVLKIKAANPDAILMASTFGDLALFAKTFADMGVKTNAILNFGGGYQNPLFASQLGKDAEGYGGSCVFSLDSISTKPHLGVINKMYKAKSGLDYDGISLEPFAALIVAADAFNRAKSTDPEKVTQALRTTELKWDILPGKGVKFNEKGENTWVSTALSQIQKGQYRLVWPADWATTKLRWPMYQQ
jgi:branched-chain amino acid transport system substrate-binding protein